MSKRTGRRVSHTLRWIGQARKRRLGSWAWADVVGVLRTKRRRCGQPEPRRGGGGPSRRPWRASTSRSEGGDYISGRWLVVESCNWTRDSDVIVVGWRHEGRAEERRGALGWSGGTGRGRARTRDISTAYAGGVWSKAWWFGVWSLSGYLDQGRSDRPGSISAFQRGSGHRGAPASLIGQACPPPITSTLWHFVRDGNE
jgi:hypothetical protein